VNLSEAIDPSAAYLANTSLPLCRLQSRTNDMVDSPGLRMNVMREVRRVPDHYILVVGTLCIDEAANIGRSIRL
jgi:hypothetical protein